MHQVYPFFPEAGNADRAGLAHDMQIWKVDPFRSVGIMVLAAGAGSAVITLAAATCNGSAGDAMSTFFAVPIPVTFGGTGTRHFATDTRGTIFQDTTDTVLAEPLAAAGTVSPVQ